MWLLLVQNAASAMSIVLGKAALNYSAPFFYIGSRMVIGGLIFLACYYILYRRISIDKKDMLLLAQIMFFQLYLAYLCDIYAISQLSAANASILYTLSPFIAALFSYFIFNEYMTPKKLGGMLIGFVGILPIALFGATPGFGASLISWTGLLLLFGITCNTYGYILMRVLVKKRNYSPFLITSLAMLGAGVCTLITSLAIESPLLLDQKNILPFLSILLLVVFFGNLVAYGLNSFLLRRYTATLIAFAGFLYPVFGALFGLIFFGEPVSQAFLYSIVLVALGLYVFYHEELRQGYYQ